MRKFAAPALLLLAGCTVVSANRTFPKLAWYWSSDAKEQRLEKAAEKAAQQAWESTNGYPKNRPKYDAPITNQATFPRSEYPLADKIAERDGTNFLGVYLGMIAEWDGCTNLYGHPKPQGVQMFSATSGELLKWISYDDFNHIFVLKDKTEYSK